MFRIGQGFDAHRFVADARLVLGGVEIPFEKGLQAHSDGDVVVHALCDALLGALALGDLGKHFPDSSDKYKGIDSRILLRRVMTLVQGQQYHVINADLTVIAQAPRLATYIEAMRNMLAADLAVESACVSVKATTTEGMGFTGRAEGIAASAIVLLKSNADACTST